MSGAAPPDLTVSSNGIGAVPDALLNTFVQGGAVVADLRAFVGLTNMTVFLVGTSTPNDGGQGMFTWNATSTQADDDGSTCVAPNGLLAGRWLRLTGDTSQIISVASVAQLRGLSTAVTPVWVEGYYAPGDGGEGMFNIGVSGADNGGTIIVSANGTYYRETQDLPWSIRWFGAKGLGSPTDDTAAIQACVTAAQVAGNTVDTSSPGSYYISNTITVGAHIKWNGGGYQADAGLFWVHHENLTQANGWRSGVIVCAPTVNAITILTNDAVEIDGVTIIYPTPASPNSGVSGILCQGIQSTGNLQIGTKISNCWISGADHSITMSNCYAWAITDCLITEHQTFGIYVTNSAGSDFGSFGDYNITGNQFWSGSVTSPFAHILLNAGGAGRISNNKLNTGGSVNVSGSAGIQVSNNTAVNVVFEPLMIDNNSIEGLGVGIDLFQNGGVSNLANVNIVGNQIWCPTPISVSGGLNWLYMTTVTGNILECQAVSGGRCMNLNGVTNMTVSGNVFEVTGGSGAAAIVRGANCTNIRQSGNVASVGVDITSGFVTPSVPASTAPQTNTSTMTMLVNIYGGTVSAVGVNGVGVSNTTPASAVLNPGDSVEISYTGGAPTWAWSPISP